MHSMVRWSCEIFFGLLVVANIGFNACYPNDPNDWKYSAAIMPILLALMNVWTVTLGALLVGNVVVVGLGTQGSIIRDLSHIIILNMILLLILYWIWRLERERFVLKVQQCIQNAHQIQCDAIISNQIEELAESQRRQQDEKQQFDMKRQAFSKIMTAMVHDLRTSTTVVQSGCRVLSRRIQKNRHHSNLESVESVEPDDKSDRSQDSPQGDGSAISILDCMAAAAKCSNLFLEGMTLSASLSIFESLSPDGPELGYSSLIPVSHDRIDIEDVIQDTLSCAELTCSSTDAVDYVAVMHIHRPPMTNI